jgi:hypothetical protein
MARRLAVVASLAVASVLTGCAPGADDELRGLVDDLAPAEKEMVSCEWESTWGGSSGVKSYYGCAWLVRGTIRRVGRPLVSRAVGNGFTVYCRGADNTFEVIAARGKKGLAMEVIAPGHARSSNISAEQDDIPRGHVLVRIGAAKFESAAPQGTADERCVA